MGSDFTPGRICLSSSFSEQSENITSPNSSTDNAVVRFSETNGKTLQNSNVTISDSDVLTVPTSSIFGNGTTDKHQFTGSVQITGSLYINGTDVSASLNTEGGNNYIQTIQAEEIITIITSAYSTSTILLPYGSIVRYISTIVLVTIPGTTTMNIGTEANPTRFQIYAAITSPSTTVSLINPTFQISNQYIRITPNVIPSDSTGRVKIQVVYDVSESS